MRAAEKVARCAALKASASILFLAKSVSLELLAEADQSIMMFPPGKQVVTPSRADGEEPEEMELVIDEATAETMEALRVELQAKADAGEGDAPYFDFNHEDGEASAWPKRIYWAGSDPKTGGVRAEVEWTGAGDAARAGKTFRRFSPAFYAADGRITGAPVNMGGLVNRAAFTRIAPLFAKQPSPKTDPDPVMTPEQIAALESENADLKTQLAELQTKLDGLMKKDAEATVELAAKEGRIGTDVALKAKWVESIIKDPAAKDLLLAMAPNPALVKQITKPVDDKQVVEDAAVLLAKYNELPRAEQPAFFAKHSAKLKMARDQSIKG
jgi:hypothetical protein